MFWTRTIIIEVSLGVTVIASIILVFYITSLYSRSTDSKEPFCSQLSPFLLHTLCIFLGVEQIQHPFPQGKKLGQRCLHNCFTFWLLGIYGFTPINLKCSSSYGSVNLFTFFFLLFIFDLTCYHSYK